MIEYRYFKKGDHYIPQYNIDHKEWKDFEKERLGNGTLYRIAEQLGLLTQNRQWFYADTKTVFYTGKIYLMAFLGAAKEYYKEETGAFEL